ncbi:MAG: hypothetical protein IT563_08550 [Alphaproteobacteria bacterium]|nr:hypothetical protein [Alphaproteobacteria bacterium]
MNQWMALRGFANPVGTAADDGESSRTGGIEPSAGRFGYARDAAITSYRNRFGRDPSETELRDSMPHFMTATDQEAYAEERGARLPMQARGLPAPPLARPTPPSSPRPLPGVPPVVPGFDPPQQPNGPHPYLDALLKTGRAVVGAYMAPAALLTSEAQRLADPEREPDPAPLQMLGRWGVEALRAHVAAYDRYKTDPRKSYQTYTKEREDLGPCRYGDKPDPNTPCYYAGSTGNIFDATRNVAIRDAAQYPLPIYRRAELDCSTRSWVSARAREQQLIEHFRDLGYSDNVINSIAEHVWRPFMKELADRECGHNAMPIPTPR